MTLTVLLFASYAEAFGAPSLELELPDGTTVAEVVAQVRALAPVAELPRAMVAVNQEYAEPGRTVASGDEVAIIPPVAGG